MSCNSSDEPKVHPLAERSFYNDDELSTFLSVLEPPIRLADLKHDIKEDPIPALSRLQRRTMAFNAWGNLALHYSADRTLSLDHKALFHKIVHRRLGGYCMENNAFFASILRGLGFELYVTGARIALAVGDGQNRDMSAEEKQIRKDGYGGWQHEVIIVFVKGDQYLVDIGFGSQGCLSPMLIKHHVRTAGVPGVTQRLVHKHIPSFTHAPEKHWIVEIHTAAKETRDQPICDEDDNVWQPAYCFAIQEWLPADFEIMNFYTSQSPESWFTHKLVLTRPILDDDGEEPLGILTLTGNELIRRMEDGKKENLGRFESEKERIEALEKWFGVKLTAEEQKGIEQSNARIRST